ncbi:glycosyltransferase [Thalassospira lucentensis]|uniref:glycosyltransferase n=1 Tax=Thalassospira lucentensis TaxID=168935 RepID=UPI003AA9027C
MTDGMTDGITDAMTIITTIRGGDGFRDRFFANLSATLRDQDFAVIVDDGSQHPVDLPQNLTNDARIHLLTPGKIGRGAALNIAIKAAPTKLIAIQDVDDLSLPGRLAAQAAFLLNHPNCLLFGRATSDRPWLWPMNHWRLSAKRLYRSNPLHHSTLAFDKSVWERAGGYDRDLACCIDLDFYLRAVAQASAELIQQRTVLIDRNLDPKTRFFSQIPPKRYHQTRDQVLARHRDQIHSPVSQSPHKPNCIAMVQLPPPMHGAAAMNQHAVDALAQCTELTVLEMRFGKDLGNIAKFSLRKVATAMGLWVRLARHLPRANVLYICFAPSGTAFYRDCLYVLTAKLFGVPAILHLHGRGLANLRQNRLIARLQRLVFADQTAIVLGARLLPELESLSCDKLIIPNALPAAAFTVQTMAKCPLHHPVRLFYLSNLFRAKGIETLIKATAAVINNGIAVTLDIAGAPGDISAQELQLTLHDHGIADIATYHGPVNADQRMALFNAVDLFVFPSNYPNEAQPLVVLEAMAAGVPVITSNIATLPEFVRAGETGWLCQPDAPNDLAKTITEAINTPDQTDTMAKAARRMCETDFTLDRFTRDIYDVIDKICKDEHTHVPVPRDKNKTDNFR